MLQPMVLGPWMERVNRHGWHLRTCQCQGAVGSQSGPSQDAPCPAWLPQEGALLLISQALVAQEGLHAQENSHRPLCPCLHLLPAGYQDSGLSYSRSRQTDVKAALPLLGQVLSGSCVWESLFAFSFERCFRVKSSWFQHLIAILS